MSETSDELVGSIIQLEWEYPLDLSILVNGGKENNNDFLSSRE